ncbi:GNAT family N-acetyltransferase [Amycolatopsis balhimycina DSM 5908]|uniref:GNAT family N-acetyltransferase n=1 Tax=Amycolatopsis balhimycina DSM 5908 TaxID=1081091 RepID=A0A428WG53_AMYBA|nr:GNAT family N-acetyltransferase [Amycolatopsis balhimycina]RSM42030.1 GNAT family N-acetyltransferase [Amycolatopsis balhimycina DSM 5908]
MALTTEDVRLMQGLAQRVAATRPDLVNTDASFGELAWNWGKDHAVHGESRRHRLWFSGAELVAWGWAQLPRRVRLSDGSAKDITGAYLAYQVDPGHAGLLDTASEAGPDAAVQSHVDAWAPTSYTVSSYEGVRRAPGYRGDLHILVEAPDGTMACSAIMWLDDVNETVEFEPVGTHPAYRRRGLARALLVHGLHLALAAGARHATVASMGTPTQARDLYYSVGFRELSRDAPLVKTRAGTANAR